MTAAFELNPLISPQAAAEWFLLDMAEVSGFMRSGFANMSPLSVYGTYRPVLTKPDPWYFAGVVALEAAAITDLYTPEGAEEILREIFRQMDKTVGRNDALASELTMMLLGRLGLGSILMGRKVPEDKLGRTMLLLIGGDRALKRVMPDDKAPQQIRAALKSGKPIWWKMFARRYRLTTAPDSAVESRIAVPYGSEPQLPDNINEDASDDPVLRLEALRVALENADLPIAAKAKSTDDELDSLLESDQAEPQSTDESKKPAKPNSPTLKKDNQVDDDLPFDEDKGEPGSEESGALRLDIKYRVD
jgi:hypothetical protein